MNNYEKHFLFDKNTLKEYIKRKIDFFDSNANLEILEIGDGNINYVFKVVDKNSNKSIIVKQADKLLRSSGRPLDLNRNKIEAEVLKLEKSLAPSFIPEIYYYDDNMYALVMEDIGIYKNLRKELDSSKMFENFSEDISEFLSLSLLPTTDLYLDRAEKKRLVKKFINIELCDISEDLVFTEPYYNYKNRNIITVGNEEYVEENLYSDEKLKFEVGKLRNNFMNNAQALIHGDLHSGSIFINEKGIKIIDPEFAFYGPIGYDIGNVIGNLVFPLIKEKYTNRNEEFIVYLEKTIKEIFDKTKEKFSKKYDEIIKFPLYSNPYFKKDYLDNIFRDSLGYAGTEIIRRTVGDSKVLEVNSVTELNVKVPLERELITIGKALILEGNNIKSGEDLIKIINILY